MFHQSRYLAAILFIGVSFSVSTRGQVSGVDPSFNAVPSLELTQGSVTGQVVQPDGKVLIYGPKFVIDGVARGDIARINVDGTLDTTFNYCGCVLPVSPTNLMLAPDGKIIVAFPFIGRMIRLNADGTIDPTFSVIASNSNFASESFTVDAVQPDGKVIATRRTSFLGSVSFQLFRYNPDGTQDSTFAPIFFAAGSPMSAFVRIALLPNGKFYLAITSGVGGTGSSLSRRNANGSVDSTYDQPSFSTGSPSQTTITDLALEATGNLLVTGRFTSVNGMGRTHLVRLFPAGNVDLSFPNGAPSILNGVGLEVLPDGKILFSANVDISTAIKIFRLNPDGSNDSDYQFDTTVVSVRSDFSLDSVQRSVFWASTADGVRLTRLLSTGTRDTSFQPIVNVYGRAQASAVQTDGKVLLAGLFSRMGIVDRSGFARVNANGSPDTSFDPGIGFNTPPKTLLIQDDGKILAIGGFSSYHGAAVTGIVRMNTDGSPDSTFAPTLSDGPLSIALEGDGQILVGGSFNTVNGTVRTGLARLNPNGSLDITFNPVIGSGSVQAIAVQADGKILVGGTFSGVNGFNRNNLARLNADGSIDQAFNPSVAAVSHVISLAGGKTLVGLLVRFVRLNGDGSEDTTFTPVNFALSSGTASIDAVEVQTDGSIVVGGRFDTVGSTNRRNINITRLAPNGAHDQSFLVAGADFRVSTLSRYSNDQIIVGGEFTVIDNTSKPGVARLNLAPYRAKTPFDFNGDGRADFSVYRPSTGVWYELFAGGSTFEAPTFGLAGDVPVPADYDGDGKADEAIFRPSSGDWWYFSSLTGGYNTVRMGNNGDIPRPADFDGDGKADFVLFRPSESRWYRAGTAVGNQAPIYFGIAGDQPVTGDFDGDGKGDLAVFRPSTGDWWYAASGSANAFRTAHWGQNGDIPAPADFDGDGKTDFAVFRPSEGGWYVSKSGGGSPITMAFGTSGDRPVPADYDGDGKADVAVFRPSSGIWYLYQSTAGFAGLQWGVSSDVAVPNAFVP